MSKTDHLEESRRYDTVRPMVAGISPTRRTEKGQGRQIYKTEPPKPRRSAVNSSPRRYDREGKSGKEWRRPGKADGGVEDSDNIFPES